MRGHLFWIQCTTCSTLMTRLRTAVRFPYPGAFRSCTQGCAVLVLLPSAAPCITFQFEDTRQFFISLLSTICTTSVQEQQLASEIFFPWFAKLSFNVPDGDAAADICSCCAFVNLARSSASGLPWTINKWGNQLIKCARALNGDPDLFFERNVILACIACMCITM